MLVKQHQVGSHAHVTISRDITFMRTVRASGARRGRGAATPCSLWALSSDEMRDGQRSPHQKGPKLPESEARENGYHTHRLKVTDGWGGTSRSRSHAHGAAVQEERLPV